MFLGTLRTSAYVLEICGFEYDFMNLTLSWKLDEIQLLALLRPSDMRWDEWVHEGLEIRSPPLRKRITNLPLLINALTTELRTNRCQTLIQSHLEPLNLIIVFFEVVSRQLEEGIGDLQHQDVRMIVLVADEDAFAGAAHTMDIVVLFETLEARQDRGVFFWLRLFGAEGVVGEGVETDCFRLVAVEGFGEDGRIGGLQRGRGYG